MLRGSILAANVVVPFGRQMKDGQMMDGQRMWHTARLTIRQLRAEDWRELHELQGDPEATKYIGGAWSPEKTQETTNRIASSYATKELEWLAVADRQTDRVMG